MYQKSVDCVTIAKTSFIVGLYPQHDEYLEFSDNEFYWGFIAPHTALCLLN